MQVVLSLGEAQLGKKRIRLNWEKAVYQQLFMLANTLNLDLFEQPFTQQVVNSSFC